MPSWVVAEHYFPLGLMWGRAEGSPIAFLELTGCPSWLPAAEQPCQPQEGLAWGEIRAKCPHFAPKTRQWGSPGWVLQGWTP